MAALLGALVMPAFSGEVTVAVGLWQGWRETDLSWDIASADGAAADSRYQDIGAWTTRLGVGVALDQITLRIQGDYGVIVAGSSRDRVLAADGSLSEQVDAQSDDGWASALVVGLGWRLVPEVGYARSERSLVQRDGVRTVPDGAVLAGLDNRFSARWAGPWVALGASWHTGLGGLVVQGRVLAQAASYHATGDLNLRDDLDHPNSFSQSANGYGLTAALALTWVIDATWACSLAVEYETMHAEDGTDTLNLADGTRLTSDLVEAELQARTVLIGLSARF